MTEPSTDTAHLVDYYRRRASEYERVYDKPERQDDRRSLHAAIPAYFTGRRVLDVACGTGYWTRRLAGTATSVIAIDIANETLDIARASAREDDGIEYRLGDAWDLAAVDGAVDAALVAFWWSHVRREDLARFLDGLHRRLRLGARVLVVDNRYVEGSNYPITRTDGTGNTYQRRALESGAEFEVLKNFPTASEVRAAVLAAGGGEPTVHELPHFWYATYDVPPAG
jgi:ubiquinone/menaquinone biosynthesis C-methylase UbiE